MSTDLGLLYLKYISENVSPSVREYESEKFTFESITLIQHQFEYSNILSKSASKLDNFRLFLIFRINLDNFEAKFEIMPQNMPQIGRKFSNFWSNMS